VAVSFLSIGFWKTLLISVFFIAGWTLGRGKVVREWLYETKRRLFNRDA
jgi:uncharacterized membrane protein